MLTYVLVSKNNYVLDCFISLLESNYKVLQCSGVITELEGATQKIIKLKPDVLVLDPDDLSLDVFIILDQLNNSSIKTVLLSDTERYAYTAFLYGVTEYILKGQIPAVLDKIVLRLMNKLSTKTDTIKKVKPKFSDSKRISISTTEGLIFIDIDTIIRIEADRSYCYLRLANGIKKTVCKSLKDIEQLLSDSQFYRTHNSHLVNLSYVEMIGYQDGGYVQMKDGSHVPIARRRKSDLMDCMTA